MICYKCDMCGDLHYSIGEMNNVKVSYAGKAHCAYPNDGEFIVCDKCEGKLIEMLMYAQSRVTQEKEREEMKKCATCKYCYTRSGVGYCNNKNSEYNLLKVSLMESICDKYELHN